MVSRVKVLAPVIFTKDPETYARAESEVRLELPACLEFQLAAEAILPSAKVPIQYGVKV